MPVDLVAAGVRERPLHRAQFASAAATEFNSWTFPSNWDRLAGPFGAKVLITNCQ